MQRGSFRQRAALAMLMLILAACLFLWTGRESVTGFASLLPEFSPPLDEAPATMVTDIFTNTAAEESPLVGIATENIYAGNVSAENHPTGNTSMENTPAGNAQAENIPAGGVPPGEWVDNPSANSNTILDSLSPQYTAGDLIGVNDIVFQPETSVEDAESSARTEVVTVEDKDKLYDYDYLRTQFYLSDANTGLLPTDIDVDAFLQKDFSLKGSASGPQILIFHTHSNEMYADSDPENLFDGVMGAGRKLAELLTEKYGLETLHHTGRYDIVDGKSQIPGAYERMEPEIEKLLKDNPTIQMVIDLHRDGLREGVAPMVTEINGKRTARIMFVNGLCRLRSNGVLSAVGGLSNPYMADNLALSFRMQLEANRQYPNFTRKLYLKAYRYSLHMMPKSLLVEVGAQNNTKAEALNAMEALAAIIAPVVSP